MAQNNKYQESDVVKMDMSNQKFYQGRRTQYYYRMNTVKSKVFG